MQTAENSPGALLASLFSPDANKSGLVLITGPKGSGKTLWCMDLIGRARARGMYVCGLVSPSVIETGKKVGIDLKDLRTGERRRLAYRRGTPDGDVQTQDWQMVAETLEWGNSILEEIETCDLFILDEIGPFELEHNIGLVEGLRIIDGAKDFPCVVVIRPSLVKEARKRWPWAKVLDVSVGAKP